MKTHAARLAGFALLVAAFGGCALVPAAPPAPVKAYAGPERPAAEIGVVRLGPDGGGFRDNTFVEYGDGSSILGTHRVGFARELHMLPGTYRVVVHCSAGTGFARPSLMLRVAAGSIYHVGCARQGFDNRTIRVGVVDIQTAGATN